MMTPMRQKFPAVACLCVAALLAATGGYAAGLTLQDAVAKVERETHGKVLSAETKHNGKRTVYRIKLLTHDGQVRVIEVPADN
jgi:uncharacterized membrane protein YkoI